MLHHRTAIRSSLSDLEHMLGRSSGRINAALDTCLSITVSLPQSMDSAELEWRAGQLQIEIENLRDWGVRRAQHMREAKRTAVEDLLFTLQYHSRQLLRRMSQEPTTRHDSTSEDDSDVSSFWFGRPVRLDQSDEASGDDLVTTKIPA